LCFLFFSAAGATGSRVGSVPTAAATLSGAQATAVRATHPKVSRRCCEHRCEQNRSVKKVHFTNATGSANTTYTSDATLSGAQATAAMATRPKVSRRCCEQRCEQAVKKVHFTNATGSANTTYTSDATLSGPRATAAMATRRSHVAAVNRGVNRTGCEERTCDRRPRCNRHAQHIQKSDAPKAADCCCEQRCEQRL